MATDVLVPPLGQTIDTLILVAWYKQEGETVTQGEPLFAVETDKATLDVEAPASGILRRISAAAGAEVKVLSAIAVIAAADEEIASPVSEANPQPETGEQTTAQVPSRAAGSQNRLFISPRARRLAQEQHVPLASLSGSGPDGAIVEQDVNGVSHFNGVFRNKNVLVEALERTGFGNGPPDFEMIVVLLAGR